MTHAHTRYRVITRGSGLITLVLISSLASAADFPQRVESANRSNREGLSRAEIALMKAKKGPGKDAGAEFFMKRFAQSKSQITTAGPSNRTTKKERIDVMGQGWGLKVYNDGTKVRYRNYGALDSKMNLAKPATQKMSLQQLESVGRQFIDSHLKDVITLGPNESLVPHFTQHQIIGGGATAPGAKPDEDRVVASTVVFSRAIDGTPVVGPGSKVAVLFANDGSPVGFDFDWPAYEPAGKTQKLLDRANIQKRMQQLASVKLDAPNVKVQRLECGYYDAGNKKRNPSNPIQAGCLVQSVTREIVDPALNSKDPNSGHILRATIDPIPVGVTVEPDASWPHAAKFHGAQLPRAGGPAPAPQPPATR